MSKRPSPPPEKIVAKLSRDDLEKGIRRIQRRLDQVKAFDPRTLDVQDPSSTVRPFETDIETALSETFGHETIEYDRFSAAKYFNWPIYIGNEGRHDEKVQSVARARQRSIQLLTAAIDLLKERLEDAPVSHVEVAPITQITNRIFIVHGHDNEPKEAVARFIGSLGFEAVILHEQPNRGRTIIQKFREESSDVGFAIVLMTPDDRTDDGRMRARQNVILELGFFLGALGPQRVAAVVKGDVERPSDFDGVLYVPYDSGWKIAVAKELQAAGHMIDWNRVMA